MPTDSYSVWEIQSLDGDWVQFKYRSTLPHTREAVLNHIQVSWDWWYHYRPETLRDAEAHARKQWGVTFHLGGCV